MLGGQERAGKPSEILVPLTNLQSAIHVITQDDLFRATWMFFFRVTPKKCSHKDTEVTLQQ